MFDTVDLGDPIDLGRRSAIVKDWLVEAEREGRPFEPEDYYVAANAHFVGDLNGDGFIDAAFGHGTFIADIIGRTVLRRWSTSAPSPQPMV